MMRKLARYISVILLVVFVSAFSVQSFAVLTRSFKIELYGLLYGKYAKTVHPPLEDLALSEGSPCEEETENESETQLGPIALTNFCHKIISLQSPSSDPEMSMVCAHAPDPPHHLYLTIHAFRV